MKTKIKLGEFDKPLPTPSETEIALDALRPKWWQRLLQWILRTEKPAKNSLVLRDEDCKPITLRLRRDPKIEERKQAWCASRPPIPLK